MPRKKAEYKAFPEGGVFVVRHINNGRAYSRPVREGLALDIARVFNSGAIIDPAPITEPGFAVIRICAGDDDFRMIAVSELTKLALRKNRKKVEADLWSKSIRCPIDNSGQVDYELCPDSDQSWSDLREVLEDENRD